MLAWAHIYLGRILDVEDKRDDAVAEYKSALNVRDSQPDTRNAAEKGVKEPFALPKHDAPDGDDDAEILRPKHRPLRQHQRSIRNRKLPRPRPLRRTLQVERATGFAGT